jgi:hypothetical protein
MSRNHNKDLYIITLKSASSYLELAKINNNSININQTDDFHVYYTLSIIALEYATKYVDFYYNNVESKNYLNIAKQALEIKDFEIAIEYINVIIEFNNTESIINNDNIM